MQFEIDTDTYVRLADDSASGYTLELRNGHDVVGADMTREQLIDLFYSIGDFLFPYNDIVLE